MSVSLTPQEFYGERIPAQFNRGPDARSGRGADATIRIDVAGEGTFFLNLDAGRMSAGECAAHPPFLRVQQDRRAFERLAADAGDSAPALLGGLVGLAGELALTRERVAELRAIDAGVALEVVGGGGFALEMHFGAGTPPAEPAATIRMDEASYSALRSGALDAQTAFLEHRIQVTGDMQVALQLALAVVAPG